MKDELSDFRASIDNDEGLQSKRKLLVMVCIIFLALNLTGATLEEANTFLFKIKFTNYAGLSYLFLAAIIFLTIRYYSYAQDHHSKLYKYWSQRLIENYRILYYSHEDDDPKGLLGKAIDVYIRDEPGISKAKYCVSGIFKRSISYTSPGFDETGVQCYFTKHIPLTNFGEQWKLHHYLWLLWYELAYQSEARRRQKLSATPDLSGTVLPLCLIPNSALKSAPPFKSVVPKASACAGLPA